jgi:hypothetical protein
MSVVLQEAFGDPTQRPTAFFLQYLTDEAKGTEGDTVLIRVLDQLAKYKVGACKLLLCTLSNVAPQSLTRPNLRKDRADTLIRKYVTGEQKLTFLTPETSAALSKVRKPKLSVQAPTRLTAPRRGTVNDLVRGHGARDPRALGGGLRGLPEITAVPGVHQGGDASRGPDAR